MTKYYAGIGSRSAPKAICDKMTTIAVRLEAMGYTLRSGGAMGADAAFAKEVTSKQVFLPWDDFNGQRLSYAIPAEAYVIARQHHPGWDYLNDTVRKMMARNAMQILGPELNSPSEFVICWTPDGCANAAERTPGTGGTGQAIAHASCLGLPVFNLARNDHYLRLHQFINASQITNHI
jgi:hypothetical protein